MVRVTGILSFWFWMLCPAFVSAGMEKDYQYEVSWDYWDGQSWGVWGKLDVRLNGKNIGNPSQAFNTLNSLLVKKGEHLRLDMPVAPAGARPSVPFYRYSHFLHRWIKYGGLIDVYENGRKLNAYTITWKPVKWWLKWLNGNQIVKTMDDATWIVNGVEIGNGANLSKLIDKWKTERNVFVQVLVPSGWEDPNFGNPSDMGPAPGEAYGRIWDLAAKRKLRLFIITPEDVHMYDPQLNY